MWAHTRNWKIPVARMPGEGAESQGNEASMGRRPVHKDHWGPVINLFLVLKPIGSHRRVLSRAMCWFALKKDYFHSHCKMEAGGAQGQMPGRPVSWLWPPGERWCPWNMERRVRFQLQEGRELILKEEFQEVGSFLARNGKNNSDK